MLQCSHVMAMAVQKLFPGAQVTIGPAIERGFYYDFDMPEPITEKDLKAVKKEMQRIIKADLPFVKEEVSQPFCLHQQSASTWQLPHFGPASCTTSCAVQVQHRSRLQQQMQSISLYLSGCVMSPHSKSCLP